jgi:hypothetical protein
MIPGAVKLGVAVGVGYTVGGNAGEYVLRQFTSTAEPTTHIGAQWAGRIITFAGLLYLMRGV